MTPKWKLKFFPSYFHQLVLSRRPHFISVFVELGMVFFIIFLDWRLSINRVNFNLFIPVWPGCFKTFVNCVDGGHFDVNFPAYWRGTSQVGWKIGVVSPCGVLPFDDPLRLFLLNLLPENTFHEFTVLFAESSAQVSSLGLLSFDGLLKLKQLFSRRTGMTLWTLHTTKCGIPIVWMDCL